MFQFLGLLSGRGWGEGGVRKDLVGKARGNYVGVSVLHYFLSRNVFMLELYIPYIVYSANPYFSHYTVTRIYKLK